MVDRVRILTHDELSLADYESADLGHWSNDPFVYILFIILQFTTLSIFIFNPVWVEHC